MSSGFWGGLLGGSNTNLNTDIGATGQAASNLTGQGQSNLNSASTFWNSIVGGDATKQTQALSPEISAAKTSAAQTSKTNAQFGTRSGGTAAFAAAKNDKVHGYIANIVGNLTGQGASELGSLGSNEVSQGLSAYGQNAQLSQERLQNWSDSILGKGITSGVAAGESAGLGAAGV